jgi:hypothetical protein
MPGAVGVTEHPLCHDFCALVATQRCRLLHLIQSQQRDDARAKWWVQLGQAKHRTQNGTRPSCKLGDFGEVETCPNRQSMACEVRGRLACRAEQSDDLTLDALLEVRVEAQETVVAVRAAPAETTAVAAGAAAAAAPASRDLTGAPAVMVGRTALTRALSMRAYMHQPSG